MSPFQYLLMYRNLTVPLVNGTSILGVDVHEYRNAQDLFDRRNLDNDPTNDVDNMPADWDASDGWNTAWSALSSKIARHGKVAGSSKYRVQLPLATKDDPTPTVKFDEIVDRSVLGRVFTGKGTPELCILALRLAEAFGLVKGTLAAMKKYCDDYIGLDCNGFVGSYLRMRGCTLVDHETPAYPNDFLVENRRISKLDDIKPESVLVWKSAGHVAIVDSVLGMVPVGPKLDTMALQCMVCEATAARLVAGDIHTDGLNWTLYQFYPPNGNKVFNVQRGLGGTGLNEVYVGNLL